MLIEKMYMCTPLGLGYSLQGVALNVYLSCLQRWIIASYDFVLAMPPNTLNNEAVCDGQWHGKYLTLMLGDATVKTKPNSRC